MITKSADQSQNILSAIRALIDAKGDQTFAEILTEVRWQCSEVSTLGEAFSKVKSSLTYLQEMNIIVSKQIYDDSVVYYGYPD